jgi:uncharacterized protein (DUF2252 family)
MQDISTISRRQAYAERRAAGKARRCLVPRESLGELSASERDPVAILAASDQGRLKSLLPIRYDRMARSPYAFLRGAAAIMAADLAARPAPGILAQCCGDCHLMNFGALLSSDGHPLFDINDFDETLPDVDFTVDVKRLCASIAVAAEDAGRSSSRTREVAGLAATGYRRHMARLAKLSPLEAWRDRVDLAQEAETLGDGLAARLRALLAEGKAAREDDNFPHVTRDAQGVPRIEDRPPGIYHIEDSDDPDARLDISRLFESCGDTLNPEVVALLRRYELTDAAFKVVGVGSVGTYCAIGLFATEDGQPLFLQLKEARASVLAPLALRTSAAFCATQGKRVVNGQRVMQASSDLFLGWGRDRESGRQFYVRHLKNRRLDSVAELMERHALPSYAELCGRVLARAHARTADPAVVSGYLGKGGAFDDAMASFAMLYAERNRKDHAEFLSWLSRGESFDDEKGAMLGS